MNENQRDETGSPQAGSSATSASGSGRERKSTKPSKKARRTFLTQSACKRCRRKKSKCDGKRPDCSGCKKMGAECAYDVSQEGITRMQHLQQQLEGRNEEYGRLMRLFSALRSGSDYDATTLLAHLRLGESIDNLIAVVEAPLGSPTTLREDLSPQEGPQRSDSQMWPTSPLQNNSFTSWSARCQTSGRTLSQSSQPLNKRSSIATRPAVSDSNFRALELFNPGRQCNSVSPQYAKYSLHRTALAVAAGATASAEISLLTIS